MRRQESGRYPVPNIGRMAYVQSFDHLIESIQVFLIGPRGKTAVQRRSAAIENVFRKPDVAALPGDAPESAVSCYARQVMDVALEA